MCDLSQIGRVRTSDTGLYSCCISNESGDVWTKEVIISVLESNPQLRIIRQPCFPNNAPVQTGAELHLRCEVAGAEPITYQWYCNDIPLNGKTQPSLMWEAVPFHGNTKLKFRCRIENPLGCVDTDLASVDVDTTTSQQQHKGVLLTPKIIEIFL
jgi:hypothetical protein